MKINTRKSSMYSKKYSDFFDRYRTLKKILPKKKLICFDIGANEGQTILEIFKNFPKSVIHSFEPQKECYEKLLYLKEKLKNKIYINMVGCGEKNIIKHFYPSPINSQTSSFLKTNIKSRFYIKMKHWTKNKERERGGDDKKFNNPIKVKQIRLSDYIENNNIKKIDLVKIDVEGYQLNVLQGLKKSFNKIKTIVVEINFVDYYSKMSSFYEIEKILGKNFKLWDISFVYKNPKYFSTDLVDAIYINKSFYNRL